MPENDKSRKKPMSSVENVLEFLNQPVDIKNLMGIFNPAVNGGKEGAPKASGSLPNLDKQTEEILGKARRISEKEGITLEQALKRFGIDLEDEGETEPDAGALDSALVTSPVLGITVPDVTPLSSPSPVQSA